jgi:hypothetical protein
MGTAKTIAAAAPTNARPESASALAKHRKLIRCNNRQDSETIRKIVPGKLKGAGDLEIPVPKMSANLIFVLLTKSQIDG